MATLFSSGWENSGGSDVTDDGAFDWNTGTVSVVASPVKTGSYALQASGSSQAIVLTEGYNRAGSTFASCRFYMATLPASGEYLYFMGLKDASETQPIRVAIYNDGGTLKWGLYAPSGVTYVAATITAATWYHVEVERTLGAGSGVGRLWVNGALINEKTTETINTNTNRLHLGLDYTSTSHTVNIDDVFVSDAKIGFSLYPYVTQISNVDSVADIGAHSAFANQQAAADSTYDTLTEADTDTGTSTIGKTSGSGTSYRTVAANEFRGAVVTIASGASGEIQNVHFYGRGASTVNVKAVITDSSGNIVTNGVGDAVSVSTTAGDKTLTFTTKPRLAAGTYWVGIIPAANCRLYYDATTGGTSKQDTSNSYTTPTNPSDASDTTETWRILYANVTEYNYQLQLEEQFTDVPYASYDKFNLHVVTGAYSSPSEPLNIEVWDSGATEWVELAALTASTDNSLNITDYVTASDVYIRFHDDTVANDVTQSTWQIDSVYLEAIKVYTKTFTANATLEAGAASYTKTFSANGNLTKTLTKTCTVNSNLQQKRTKTFTANTNLLQRFAKTFTLNASTKANLQKTFNANSNLLTNRTKPFTFNGNLLHVNLKTFTANSNLLNAISKNFTADGNLTKNTQKNFTFNSSLQKGKELNFSVNADLTSSAVATFTYDAVITLIEIDVFPQPEYNLVKRNYPYLPLVLLALLKEYLEVKLDASA